MAGPDLKNRAAAGVIDLVFLDAEALIPPCLARRRTRRGASLRIEAPGHAKKQAMLGAFDPAPRASSPWAEGPRRLLVHISVTQHSADFVALLDRLGAAYGTIGRERPLIAVLDNGLIRRRRLTTVAGQFECNRQHHHSGAAPTDPRFARNP
ncbi:MAG: hypothetical protein AB7H90_11290 [Alphaproteobacteria bacterium]